MKVWNISCAVLLSAFVLSSCDKYNNISNTNTIKKPYVVYMGGMYGNLAKTNDGELYDWPQIAGTTHFSNGLLTTENRIIHLRKHINVADASKGYYAPVQQGNWLVRGTIIPNDSFGGNYLNVMVHDKSRNEVYVSTTNGIVISANGGKDQFLLDGKLPPTGLTFPTSIVQLGNSKLYTYDETSKKVCRRDLPSGGVLQNWANTSAALPTANSQRWMLASQGDVLWAIEKRMLNQPRYSTDEGASFTSASGLPDTATVTLAKTVKINGAMYVGIDSVGLYRYDKASNKFMLSNGGLPQYIRVFDIVSKRNEYVSGETKDYIFIATNLGLYMSDDDGKNWVRKQNNAWGALD
jgi:hypothetical protein